MTSESVTQAITRIERALRNRCDPNSACVTAVPGRSAAEVLSDFGADPTAAPVMPHGLPSDMPAVSLLEVPGGIIAVEDGGLEGRELPTLQRLSRGTHAASLFTSLGIVSIAFARDGIVLPGTGDELPTGGVGVPPDVAALFDGLDQSIHGHAYCGLIAIERFTGLRIDGEPPPSPAPVHVIRPTRERLSPASAAVHAATLTYEGNEDRTALSAAVGRLSPIEQRRLAVAAVQFIVRIAELHTSPDIIEAVEWLTKPSGPRFSETIEIAMLHARDAEAHGQGDVKARALRVLATAANPDPQFAALEASWGARAVLAPSAQARFEASLQDLIGRGFEGLT